MILWEFMGQYKDWCVSVDLLFILAFRFRHD